MNLEIPFVSPKCWIVLCQIVPLLYLSHSPAGSLLLLPPNLHIHIVLPMDGSSTTHTWKMTILLAPSDTEDFHHIWISFSATYLFLLIYFSLLVVFQISITMIGIYFWGPHSIGSSSPITPFQPGLSLCYPDGYSMHFPPLVFSQLEHFLLCLLQTPITLIFQACIQISPLSQCLPYTLDLALL